MKTPNHRLGQRGQIIIMVGLATIVMFGIVGLAVDVGRLYVTRVELGRSLDAAALSGILELNGQPSGITNAEAKALAYFNDNETNATPSITICEGDPGPPCNGETHTLTMDATKTIDTIFISVLGIKTASVSAHAKAGFAVEPVDIVIVQDDTGTMKSGCNGTPDDPSSQTNSDCPVKQARDGAKAFLDILPIGCANCAMQVAIVPFRGCYSDGSDPYNPVSGESYFNIRGCIIQDQIINLTDDVNALKNHIDTLSAPGGYPGTNVCLGIREGYKRLTGAGSQANARKIMVVLTDGDNRYSDGASNSTRGGGNGSADGTRPGIYNTDTWPNGQGAGSGSPSAAECQPTGSTNGPLYSSGCTSGWCTPQANQRINSMDVGTYNMANALKADDVEIYVLRFSSPSGDLPYTTVCDPGMIGPAGSSTPSGRNNANEQYDQNLSRCIASSSSATNDHYFYAAVPEDISNLFEIIAQSISHRLIE